jgi:DNA-binding MarR family transcriptional regulator
MTQQAEASPARDNINSLTYLLGVEIEERLAKQRLGTPYEHVRKSDVRVFVAASRGRLTISEIARTLGVSRQAVHMSAQRLQDLKVVELQPAPEDRREKILVLSAMGLAVGQNAKKQIEAVEAEFEEVIGKDGMETLRSHITTLLEHARASNNKEAWIKPQA